MIKVGRTINLAIFAVVVFLANVSPLLGANSSTVPITVQCMSTSPTAGTLGPNIGLDGTWNRPRRDRGLTGRSPLIGSITCPQELWQIDLSKRGIWLELLPADNSATVPLTMVDQGNFWSARNKFDYQGGLIDLSNNGSFQEHPSGANRKIGDFLASVPGFERIQCDWSANGGGQAPGSCFLHKWENDNWVEVWKSQPLDQFFSNTLNLQSPIVADIDNDGELEVSVTVWYVVHVLDLATGTLEYTGQFTDPNGQMSGRPYGLHGVFDITGDNRMEIIILSDFLPTIQVLGWNASGQLIELWDRVIETIIELNEKIHLVIANPIADVTGNGVPEIITNIFNENGDGRWHALVLNAANGSEVVNLSDHFVAGVWDLNGDGVAELLLNETDGQVVKENGPAILASVVGAQTVERLRLNAEGFEWTILKDFHQTVNGGATLASPSFIQHPAVFRGWDGLHAVFVTRKTLGNNQKRFRLWSFDGTNVTEEASITGPELKIIGTEANDGSGAIMVRSSFRDIGAGDVQLTKMSAQQIHSSRTDRSSGPLATFGSLLTGTVVAANGTGVPLMVSQGFGDSIHAYEMNLSTGMPVSKWQVPGRGMFAGVNGVSLVHDGIASILAYDPFGNGVSHFVVARKNADGGGQLVSLKPDGSILWTRDFPVFGDTPIWNNSGITHWVGGHFRSNVDEDVYAVIRKNNMHDDKSFMLDGKTGSIIWDRTRGPDRSGCSPPGHSGPNPYQVALIDWDGDGLDDISDFANSTFGIFKGTNGIKLINRWVEKGCTPGNDFFNFNTFANQVLGIVEPLTQNGPNSILWAGNPSNLGLIGLDGNSVWSTPSNEGMPGVTLQIPADTNGDGTREVIVIGHCGTPGSEIRAYNSNDGSLKWTMANSKICEWPAPAAPSAADIDGDGRDEVIFTHQSTVYALAEQNNAGVVRWQAILSPNNWWPYEVGSPVIADVQGWGQPQILVNTANGYLISLGIIEQDTDSDGYPDRVDAFPTDASETTDTDNDGIGNNADPDDDDDGMPDAFETANGLDQFNPADASGDLDRDGFTNLQEFLAGTDPNDPDPNPATAILPILQMLTE